MRATHSQNKYAAETRNALKNKSMGTLYMGYVLYFKDSIPYTIFSF